jgi:hypothetical protein
MTNVILAAASILIEIALFNRYPMCQAHYSLNALSHLEFTTILQRK